MGLSSLLDSLGLKVSSEAFVALEGLVDELLRWNQRRNLTAITDYDEVLEKHLVDSLTLLEFARTSNRMLDIGSGAGFPALPLKIACPELEVVSVDAVGKKVDFQRHVARQLKLSGFSACHERIENLSALPGYLKSFDLITARALCSLEELFSLAQPFLEPSGRIVAMKGPEGAAEVALLKAVLDESVWAIKLHRFTLPLSGAKRCLVELYKNP